MRNQACDSLNSLFFVCGKTGRETYKTGSGGRKKVYNKAKHREHIYEKIFTKATACLLASILGLSGSSLPVCASEFTDGMEIQAAEDTEQK